MWGAEFKLENWLHGSEAPRVYRRFLWISRHVMGPSVLDVGCSHGSLTRFIADKNIKRYLGVDVNKKSLEFARKKYGGYEWAKFLHTIPAQEQFATIVLAEVLEHQDNPDKFLAFVLRHAGPETKIIITIPHGIDEVSDHRQVFFTDTFQHLMQKCRLGLERMEYHEGRIWVVATKALYRGSLRIDPTPGERNISHRLENFIASYRVMERNYETMRGVRLAKTVKGWFRKGKPATRTPEILSCEEIKREKKT